MNRGFSQTDLLRPARRTAGPLLIAGFVAGLMSAFGPTPAGAAPGTPGALPPVADAPSGERHVGKIIWAQLVTPDLAAAQSFYGGLFGWTFRDVRSGDARYSLALLDGRPVAGLIEKPPPAGEKRQPAWLTFIAASDVDAVGRAARAHGGKVLVRPRTYPLRGREAVLADPEGAVFAVLSSRTGDPPDYLADPGAWIWSTLLASNADIDAGFYRSLFGYDVFDLPSEDGRRHVILSTDDYARAGINQLPADAAHRHPHWLDFIRVTDADAAAAKALSLGGRVLVEPRVDRHGGKLAVLADPAGAPFGVMEWSLADSNEEPK